MIDWDKAQAEIDAAAAGILDKHEGDHFIRMIQRDGPQICVSPHPTYPRTLQKGIVHIVGGHARLYVLSMDRPDSRDAVDIDADLFARWKAIQEYDHPVEKMVTVPHVRVAPSYRGEKKGWDIMKSVIHTYMDSHVLFVVDPRPSNHHDMGDYREYWTSFGFYPHDTVPDPFLILDTSFQHGI